MTLGWVNTDNLKLWQNLFVDEGEITEPPRSGSYFLTKDPG
jgi:hypothetical protein